MHRCPRAPPRPPLASAAPGASRRSASSGAPAAAARRRTARPRASFESPRIRTAGRNATCATPWNGSTSCMHRDLKRDVSHDRQVVIAPVVGQRRQVERLRCLPSDAAYRAARRRPGRRQARPAAPARRPRPPPDRCLAACPTRSGRGRSQRIDGARATRACVKLCHKLHSTPTNLMSYPSCRTPDFTRAA
jgi:hypothetical protein